MHDNSTILLPSRPRIISSDSEKGVFEIDDLYPGYGVTVGNVFRRILLSSLPGAAVTQVKIEGVQHEFSTISGIREDVIAILLNIKKLRFFMHTNESQRLQISVKGEKNVTGDDIIASSSIEVANKDLLLATLTEKNASLNIELVVEMGLGYVPREAAHREKVEVGMMTVDALFSPVRRVHYEVENMRVGDRTDYNRLRITIETDGTISPEDVFQRSASIAVQQFSVLTEGFRTAEEKDSEEEHSFYQETDMTMADEVSPNQKDEKDEMDFSKVKVEDLRLPSRTIHALHEHGIKTVSGLLRRDVDQLSKIPGIGDKAIIEVKRALGSMGLTLK